MFKKAGVIIAACALLLVASGCAHEVLNVPPRSAMLGKIQLNQTYELKRNTTMDRIVQSDSQPRINLFYWANQPAPAEAFQRVPFSVGTSGDSAGYSPVTIKSGTPLSLAEVEVYNNSHVYLGRILAGDSANVHILLVIPIGNETLPAIGDIQAQDLPYIQPRGAAAAILSYFLHRKIHICRTSSLAAGRQPLPNEGNARGPAKPKGG